MLTIKKSSSGTDEHSEQLCISGKPEELAILCNKLSKRKIEAVIKEYPKFSKLLDVMTIEEISTYCLDNLVHCCEKCQNPILDRPGDFLKVMLSAIDHEILDKKFALVNKRHVKEKFAALIFQMFSRGYFKRYVNDRKLKQCDIIKFVKEEFQFDMSNYFYRNSKKTKLSKMLVLCEIDLNEIKNRR